LQRFLSLKISSANVRRSPPPHFHSPLDDSRSASHFFYHPPLSWVCCGTFDLTFHAVPFRVVLSSLASRPDMVFSLSTFLYSRRFLRYPPRAQGAPVSFFDPLVFPSLWDLPKTLPRHAGFRSGLKRLSRWAFPPNSLGSLSSDKSLLLRFFGLRRLGGARAARFSIVSRTSFASPF